MDTFVPRRLLTNVDKSKLPTLISRNLSTLPWKTGEVTMDIICPNSRKSRQKANYFTMVQAALTEKFLRNDKDEGKQQDSNKKVPGSLSDEPVPTEVKFFVAKTAVTLAFLSLVIVASRQVLIVLMLWYSGSLKGLKLSWLCAWCMLLMLFVVGAGRVSSSLWLTASRARHVKVVMQWAILLMMLLCVHETLVLVGMILDPNLLGPNNIVESLGMSLLITLMTYLYTSTKQEPEQIASLVSQV